MPPPKCRVLCIDDHADTSEMLQLILSQEDYVVTTALSGEAAVQLADEQEFDCFVIDKHLQDGSGLDVCKLLNELAPDVPCVIYSGDAYEIHRSEALAAGADDYVVKPDLDRLIESIRQLLSQRECATAG